MDEYNSMKKLLENDVTHWGLNWMYHFIHIILDTMLKRSVSKKNGNSYPEERICQSLKKIKLNMCKHIAIKKWPKISRNRLKHSYLVSMNSSLRI